MRHLLLITWFLAVGLAACNAKKEAPAPAGSNSAAPVAAAPAATGGSVTLAEVNAAIPEALRSKLKFVEGNYKDGKRSAPAIVPEGWAPAEFNPTKFLAPESANWGIRTSYELGNNCDGMCSPKDWAPIADKVEFEQYKGKEYTITKDEKLPNSRLLIATEKDGPTHVHLAKWKSGADRYFSCTVSLEGEVAAAADAFAKACHGLVPSF